MKLSSAACSAIALLPLGPSASGTEKEPLANGIGGPDKVEHIPLDSISLVTE